jgi:hypothetical protein
MPAMSGIDRTIEDHRRDPDPHPRWRKQIDEALAQLGAQIDALTPTNDMPEIPLPGTSTPKPVEHGVDPAVGSKTVFSREDHQHQLILPPVLEHMAAIAGPGVVQADGDDNLTAVQKASGRVAVWDEEGMTARDGLDWDDATTTLEPRNDFTMEADPLSDHYGRGTISKSSGWLFSTWSEPGGPGGHWLVNDYTVGGNRTVTVTYGATIGGGDCGFSVKLYLGLPSGSPKHTLDLPLGRIRIFQDQDTLYVKNAAGTNLWSRALPTASDAEEWVTIAVTVSGSTATVYQNGVEVATGTATAGTATGATITFANWNFPNQWRSCGFCELVIWDRLPNEADLLAARTRTRPVAGTTPNRLNIGPDADLRMIDHAAATRRVQTAMPDGTLTAVHPGPTRHPPRRTAGRMRPSATTCSWRWPATGRIASSPRRMA